jgi:hypothetical protein
MSNARQQFRDSLVEGLSDPEIREYDLWQPQPGPQLMAFESEADELFFGGSAGGGKTDSLIGMALRSHNQSIIFRREFPQFRSLIPRVDEMLAPLGITYKQNWSWWAMPDGRKIELGSVPKEGDLQKYRGRPHDFIGFDEGTEFPEFWYRFLTAWNRSSDPRQRCRIVIASNPPTTDEGQWVIKYWAPWLDDTHDNPAEPGELRWFVNIDEKSIEVEGPEPLKIDGIKVTPRSRTFIPSRLEDNAYLRDTNYRALLMGLPQELKEVFLDGKFMTSQSWSAFQVVKSKIAREAQARWKQPSKKAIPDAIGIDPARGGNDNTAIAYLYGDTFTLSTIPGKRTPDGPAVARFVLNELKEFGGQLTNIPIGVDIIGAGTSVADVLRANDIGKVKEIHASAKSRARSKHLRLRFSNLRAQYHFRFSEALEEEDLAIPKGVEVLADVTAARYTTTVRGIQVEDKQTLKKRLGRSPDRAEAFMLCWHAYRHASVLSSMVIDEW